jgi:hypothetical protein
MAGELSQVAALDEEKECQSSLSAHWLASRKKMFEDVANEQSLG